MANGNYLVVESLQKLISAVNSYGAKLVQNGTILRNAGNVCDAAMGSDANAQKHMRKLEEALGELEKAVQVVNEVGTALQKDLMQAIDTNDI